MKKYEKYETYVCPEKVKFIYFYFYFFLNKPNRILPRDLRSQQPKKNWVLFPLSYIFTDNDIRIRKKSFTSMDI